MVDRNTLRVLLASPSDVGDERETVDRLIGEINDTLPASNAARLELVRWETRTVPDIGTDAQDAVNRQLGNEFEVFVGILWTRFGTPTPRAPSGTQEEFERALARKQARPETQILFYFRTSDVPHDVDLEQLRLVRRFREGIRDGGLTRDYATLEEFARNVRMALTRVALGAHDEESTRSTEAGGAASRETPVEEDPGLYDLVDEANESFGGVQRIAISFAEGMEELSERTTGATAELQGLHGHVGATTAGARRIVNSLAEFMASYASRLEAQLAPFREGCERGFDSISGLAEVAPDFGTTAIEPMLENLGKLGELRVAVTSALSSLGGLRIVIEKLPRVTTKFNRSKRRVLAAFAQLIAEMKSAERSAEEAERLLTDVVATLERLC